MSNITRVVRCDTCQIILREGEFELHILVHVIDPPLGRVANLVLHSVDLEAPLRMWEAERKKE